MSRILEAMQEENKLDKIDKITLTELLHKSNIDLYHSRFKINNSFEKTTL